MVDLSRETGILYEFNDVLEGPTAHELKNIDFKQLSETIDSNWGIQWKDLPDKEWNEAQRLLNLMITEENSPRNNI